MAGLWLRVIPGRVPPAFGRCRGPITAYALSRKRTSNAGKWDGCGQSECGARQRTQTQIFIFRGRKRKGGGSFFVFTATLWGKCLVHTQTAIVWRTATL